MEPGGRLRAATVAQFMRFAISSSKRAGDGVRTEDPPSGGRQYSRAAETTSNGSTGTSGAGGRGTAETLEESVLKATQVPLSESSDDPPALSRDEHPERSDASQLEKQSADKDRGIEGEESESSSRYTVAYECYEIEQPEENLNDDISCEGVGLFGTQPNDGAERLQFIDVLLQPDEHGLGLNIRAERSNVSAKAQASSTPRVRYASRRVLVVASFRRLHPSDIGPAEATRQIQKGDILHSVDGEQVRDWQHLLSIVNRSTRWIRSNQPDPTDKGSKPFLLLRFLRRRVDSPLESPASTASLSADEETFPSNTEKAKGVECFEQLRYAIDDQSSPLHDSADFEAQNSHHVALLIRELAIKNQTLQDELVTSKLKQEEQKIHLEQLYALYAKTQLDSSPLFALPKASILPFTRRVSGASASPSDNIASVLGKLTSATGAGVKANPTLKLHTEIELAVRAEQERLRKQYTLQLDIATREAAARHQRELQHLKARMEKKVEMLEAGLQEVLVRVQQAEVSRQKITQDQTTNTGFIETCSCGTWMRLQQELYIHQSLGHDGNGDNGTECLMCSLLTDARRTSSVAAASPIEEDSETQEEKLPTNVSRIQHVLELLREYEALKQVRAQRFVATAVCMKAKQADLTRRQDRDDGSY